MPAKGFIGFDDRQTLEYLQSTQGRRNLLPAVSIACSPRCNLKCPHCIYDAGKSNRSSLTPAEKVEIVENAHYLGAKFFQICHEGEPFLDPAVPKLIDRASELQMKVFMYTNASLITPEIARFLYQNEVCLGVKLDSLNPSVFNKMLGKNSAEQIYQGIRNLIEAGYNKPFKRNGKLYTRLSLVCTLTSINTENMEQIQDVAKFAWDNNLFFGAARLERGGRAIGKIWDAYKIPDKERVIALIEWCSKQTGIDYWNAQPAPYCIGVGGLQIADNGDVWLTGYGGSCDFTEPDGQSFPEDIITIGNVKDTTLDELVKMVWKFRKKVFLNGTVTKKLKEYEKTKNAYPNGLQDCGSARTYTLFLPFYRYVKHVIEQGSPDFEISSDLTVGATMSR